MIKIHNYSKLFSEVELNKIINMLSKKYIAMDLDIYLLKNKWHSLFYYFILGNDEIKNIFQSKVSGVSLHRQAKIFIYPFNYANENIEIIKLYVINTLFHEIRHQWQKLNNPIFYKKHNLNSYNYSIDSEKYSKQKHEEDATGFSQRIMIKNYKRINDIVGSHTWYFS